MIQDYIQGLQQEFSGYNRQKFTKDLMAGLTVAAVALPLALAFGVASGATASAGMITAIIAGFLISALSGASFQISGPTGAMSAILISLVASYGIQGVFIATFLAGIILILCAVFKVGRLVSVIPMPVITGFTSGIAITIALGQVDNFFGVTSEGSSVFQKVLSYGELGFHPNWAALFIGVLAVLIMALWPKRLNSKFPGSLLAIIITTIITVLWRLDIPLVGEIPKTLISEERLSFGNLNLDDLSHFIAPAISIAALGMIESLLCGASGSRMAKSPFNADVELVAQGIGNMVLPFFGGVPATAAIARSSVAIKSGSQTRLTGIIHAVGLLASMFILGGIMSKIPLSALAGVLMVTAWRMNEWDTIRYLVNHKFKSAITKFTLTMLVTVFFDLTTAILVGVVFAILSFIVKLSNVEVNAAKIDLEKVNGYEDYDISLLKQSVVVYITGPIFFGSIEKIKEVTKPYHDAQIFILSLRGVPLVDTSGLQAIQELCEEMLANGHEVIFSSVQPKVMEMFERSGLVDLIGEDKFYWSVERVLNDRKLFSKQIA